MAILDEDVARVRAETDFVQLASEHVALKKVGRRWTGLCPFHAEKSPSFTLNAEEGLFYCLAGETGVLTWEGVRPIRELAGGTHRVLSEKGRWVDAPFYSFGVQPLMKLTLTRNRQVKVIYATPEHRWLLRSSRETRNSSRYERTTQELAPGQLLCWSFSANRTRLLGDLSPFGIAHGITYGDGTVNNNMASVDLHGEKDSQLLKWFPLSRTCQLTTAKGKPFIKVYDLPLAFKDRPSLDEAPTYLFGWLAGYFAADGCVAKDGTCMLDSADRSDLEFVRAVCTRLGIGTYGITEQVRAGFEGREPSSLFRVHFINEDLDERFFLIDEHRRRFAGSKKSWIRRGWVVKAVEPTDRVEEVFCAVVEGTHNFALEDNILTGNCFGCQAKGDVITFIRDVDHLDFVEAVERLAARANITLRYDNEAASKDRQRRGKLLDAMEKAVEWYHQRLLSSPDAGQARNYLRSRGYDGDVVREFKLGWAPDDWDALAKALKLPDDVLSDTGLGFLNRRNRQQDAFRARVMFPIFDSTGKAVAFGGRQLEGDGPKYKNSQETPIYSKRRTLYGLNWAKTDVVQAGEVIVCEGYTDVIGLFRSGMPRAVATCGTALADEHFHVLKNFARRVVLAYDADAAGQAAAERFYEWEQRYEVDIAVAAMPAGSDPGDLAQRDPDGLRAAIADARPFLTFRLERVLAGTNLRAPIEARARVATKALEMIAEHPSDVVRREYVGQVAGTLGLEVERLLASMPAPGRKATPVQVRRTEAEGPELEALRLAIHQPDSVADRLEEVLFADELHLAAYRALVGAQELHEAIDAADPGAAALLQRLAVEEATAEPDDVIAGLLKLAVGRAVEEMDAEAKHAENSRERMVELSEQIGWALPWAQKLYEPAERAEAIDRLVAWLRERAEEDV